MSREEAVIVARIAKTADGGCSQCVHDLFEQLRETLPDLSHIWDEEEKKW